MKESFPVSEIINTVILFTLQYFYGGRGNIPIKSSEYWLMGKYLIDWDIYIMVLGIEEILVLKNE